MAPVLRLRPLTPRDDAALAVLFADPDTVVWNPGPDPDGVTAWRERNAQDEPDARTWAVSDEDGDLLGVVAVFRIDPAARTAEIGYRTHPAARGRGVARTAVLLALEWLEADGRVDRVVLEHGLENVASCRVAQANGFDLVATVRGTEPYGDGQLHDEHRHELRLARRPQARESA